MSAENQSGPATKKGLIAWCLYDWANSAFPTVVITFVFAAYFTKGVAKDVVTGTAQWGWAMSISALGVAIIAPILGSIADKGGRRKPWLFVFTVLTIIASALLWQIQPDVSFVMLALILAGLGNFAFEMGMVFYNAMLPDLAPRKMLGRWSGWGWGLGYIGGLSCLAVTLVGFVQTETPWFGLSKDLAEHLRATPVLVAVWFAVFAIPLFLFTPDQPSRRLSPTAAIREGIGALLETLRKIRSYSQIARYLLARMIYTDGINTLFAFGGIYAAGTFGMPFSELIMFGIAINLTAGLGAVMFAWLDDRIGPKRVILIALAALTILGGILLIIQDKTMFWVFGVPLGLFVGPAQSASRSLMAHIAPAELRTEMFGLYAFSGKATAFIGPALLALATDMFHSQRAGMATILIFFIAGGFLLLPVVDARD
ncbi:MAG: MFS transporter [Rhodospirillaceae bacterium]|nr:MFS transporter [Rhodospirillaceae bacterium]